MHRATCLPCLLAVALAGCHSEGDENLGLGARNAAVDVRRLTDVAELERALSLSGWALDQRLGPHKMEARAQLTLDLGGGRTQTLGDDFLVECDGRAVHLRRDNSDDYGFEATAVDGALYVRPRYGKFVRQRPEGDQVERLRRTAETAAAGYLGVIGHAVEVREAGRAEVAGRPALHLKLAARSSPHTPVSAGEPGKAWRDTVKVRSVDGDVMLDAKSGALLQARLAAEWSFVRDGQPLVAAVRYQQNTAGAPEAIAAPEDWVELGRTRPMLDRQTLLDGLAAGPRSGGGGAGHGARR